MQKDLQLVKKDVAFLVESRKKVQQPITSFLKATSTDDSSNKRKTAPPDTPNNKKKKKTNK